jgi:hypothetical protein
MARYHRRRELEEKGSWRHALVFNSLLLILAVLAVRVLVSAYSTQSLDGSLDAEAREETRREIDQAFETIVPDGVPSRAYWAEQIANELAQRDFSAARGYLLAAPAMLSRNDRRALLAAVNAEESGTEDERLTRAGLLFLPNDVRADYQRAVERPDMLYSEQPATPAETTDTPAPETETSGTADDETEIGVSPEELSDDPMEASEPEPSLDSQSAGFSMIGSRADLVRRSQQWVNGETTDTVQLRLSAIGLIEVSVGEAEPALLTAISVLRAAGRAGRLDEAYLTYLDERVDLALPEEELLDRLSGVVSAVVPPSVRQSQVLGAYEQSLNAEGLLRLRRDLASIAHIAAETTPAGAVTLIELAKSPEDVRKLETVAQSGSDRAVALAKAIGPRVTDLAQIGIRWSTALVSQILGLLAIFAALVWSTASAFQKMQNSRWQ